VSSGHFKHVSRVLNVLSDRVASSMDLVVPDGTISVGQDASDIIFVYSTAVDRAVSRQSSSRFN
jgi:hypothetical protein